MITEFEATKHLPYLLFDEESGYLELKGKSIDIDPIDFYDPLITKLREYVKSPKDIKMTINLEYFNSRSAKHLLEMFKTVSSVVDKGFTCTVDWMYTDEEDPILEAGQDYAELNPSIKFNFKEI